MSSDFKRISENDLKLKIINQQKKLSLSKIYDEMSHNKLC